MKRIIPIIMVLSFMLSLLFTDNVVLAEENSPIRIINVVYDDSGSMYENDAGKPVDTWCQAKYAMEVFASMLSGNDVMHVYYMSDFQNSTSKGPRITLKGSSSPQSNVDTIHKQKTTAGGTPFNAVRKAYSDLTKEKADEKWLVILTDGEFQQVKNKSEIDNFISKKSEDISVLYLGIGSQATGIEENVSENIYSIKARNSGEILLNITEICNRIFNSNKLNVSINTKTFEFDVPMRQLIVFAQGQNVSIEGIRNGSGQIIKSRISPVSVKYSECDATNYVSSPDKNLNGVLSIIDEDFTPGTYTVDVSNAETIEVYYIPNIEIAAYIYDEAGNLVPDKGYLSEGKYTIEYGFVKTGTSEKVINSQLLGNIQSEAIVYSQENPDGEVYSSGQTIILSEGNITIEATSRFLDYNKVSKVLNYSIFRDKEVTYTEISNPKYNIDNGGVTQNDPIVIKATLDGRDFTREEWEKFELPTVTLEDIKRPFEIDNPKVVKGEIGYLNIYPSIPNNGKPSSGTYSDCNFTIESEQLVEAETWSGHYSSILGMQDSRSWVVRNRKLFITILVFVALTIWLVGYIPGVKPYLPKIAKYPRITEEKETFLGIESGMDTKAERESILLFITTIIPYIAQRTVVKFRGPLKSLKLKAYRKSMSSKAILVNYEDFEGREEYTFNDGEMVEKASSTNKKKRKAFLVRTKAIYKYYRNKKTISCKLSEEFKKKSKSKGKKKRR